MTKDTQKPIKFRAWDKKRRQVRDVLSIQYFQKPLPELGAVRMVTEEDTQNNESLNFHSDVELMQYTGQKDRRGIEIYDQDILKIPEGILGYVYWDKDMLCWNVGLDGLFEYIGTDSELEIIGNVYENPELLTIGTIYE